MTDRCQITRTDPDAGGFDEDTGRFVPSGPTLIARGRCQVIVPGAEERIVEVGGTPITLGMLDVDLDYEIETFDELAVGDEFALTSSINTHLLGKSWWIIDIADGSWANARRLKVQGEQDR